MKEPQYDLEERLLDYAANIIRLVERMPDTRAGNHVAGQLLRSGTSPLPNYGEAQAAESRRDFVHKLKICHKELKESRALVVVGAARPVAQPVESPAVGQRNRGVVGDFRGERAYRS